jgi:hypothetical protein
MCVLAADDMVPTAKECCMLLTPATCFLAAKQAKILDLLRVSIFWDTDRRHPSKWREEITPTDTGIARSCSE